MFNEYEKAQCATGGGMSLGRNQITYTQRVSAAVQAAEEQLADLKRMQEIFAKHPEFEELLTLVQRGRV